MQIFKNFCLILVAFLLICAPLAAQSANPSTVTMNYSAGGPAPSAPSIVISGVAGTLTARLDQNFNSAGSTVAGGPCGTDTGVFICNVSGNTLGLGTDANVLAPLGRVGQNTFHANLLVSGTSCTDCVTVPITLQIGGNGQITVTAGGAAIPAAGLTMTASPGGTAQTQITVSTISSVPVSFNVTQPGQAWLTVSPTSGNISANSPVVLTLTANSNLVGSTPTTSFTIASAVGSAVITVNLSVANGGATFNPSSLAFTYAVNNQTYTPGQGQTLQVTGINSNTAITLSSDQSWLQINGGNLVNGFGGQSFNIGINISALGNPPAINTYTGHISVNSTAGTAICTVTLTVSGTSNASLTFNAATTNSGPPPDQSFTFQGNTSIGSTFFVNVSTTGNYNWLSALPTFGTLTGGTQIITVHADPTKVPAAGGYSGQIQILVGAVVLQTTSVTFNVGGTVSSGNIASPASLTFNVPTSGNASQSLLLNGTGGYQATAFGNGIVVSPSLGNSQPTVLTVSVNALSSGVLPGTNTGYIFITSGSTTQQVNVTFNVLAGTVLQANPASLGVIYSGDFTTNVNLFSNQDPPVSSGLNFTIGTLPSYVQVSSNSGTTPATLGVRIVGGTNGSNFQPGFNTGNIVVTASGAIDSPMNIPVNVLAPGSTSGLNLSPTSVTLPAISGGTIVTQQVSATYGISGSPFTATASSAPLNWLSVQPTSGTLPATLTITGNPQSLMAGTTYQGTVTVAVNNGPSAILNVSMPVTTTGTVNPPTISVSPASVTFNYKKGDAAPAAQTVQVNSTISPASFTVTTSNSWITATPLTGTTPTNLSITVDPSSFGAGTQSGTVTITAPGATGSPQVIQVTLNVTSPPALAVNNNKLTFTYRTDGAAPGPQSVQVTSTGDPLSFTVSIANAPWLSVSPTSGGTPATLTFTVDPSRLGVGSFTATVTLTSSTSTQSISVLLVIAAPLPTISGVVNAASLQEGAVAPGEAILITGNAMGPDTPVQFNITNGFLDKMLGGTSVKVGGYPAAMVAAGANTVIALVPYEIAGKLSTFIEVDFLGQGSNIMTLQVAPSSPGVFTPASAQGFPVAILNSDGTPNSSDNPAARGTPLTAVITGEGQTVPAGVDGKVTDPGNPPVPALAVSATINGEPSPSVTAAAGQVAGLMTVTVQVPNDGTTGDLVITVGSNSSQPGVTVFVK